MGREFIHPIKAMQHLSKLTQLAAIIPKGVRLFTLEHASLQTALYKGRKVEAAKNNSAAF